MSMCMTDASFTFSTISNTVLVTLKKKKTVNSERISAFNQDLITRKYIFKIKCNSIFNPQETIVVHVIV